MKRILFVFFACTAIMLAGAQQRPYYTQYILNMSLINPAVTGIYNYWDVKASIRRQWVGLDGAPTTSYLTIHGPLQKNDNGRVNATSVPPAGESSLGSSYGFTKSYGSTDAHSGVGLNVVKDATGPLNRFAIAASYAYHLPIGPQTNLSAGFSVGMQQIKLATDQLDFGAPNATDPAVNSNSSGVLNKVRPDIGAGIWFYTADYFIGLSAQNILQSDLFFGNDTVKLEHSKLLPHLFFTAGYKMKIGDDVSVLPSIMIRKVDPLPWAFDLNAKFAYRDIFWVGGSYRYQNGFAAMLGINISGSVNLGYSYDISTSGLNTVSKGTQEIMVGFLLGNGFGGDSGFKNLW